MRRSDRHRVTGMASADSACTPTNPSLPSTLLPMVIGSRCGRFRGGKWRRCRAAQFCEYSTDLRRQQQQQHVKDVLTVLIGPAGKVTTWRWARTRNRRLTDGTDKGGGRWATRVMSGWLTDWLTGRPTQQPPGRRAYARYVRMGNSSARCTTNGDLMKTSRLLMPWRTIKTKMRRCPLLSGRQFCRDLRFAVPLAALRSRLRDKVQVASSWLHELNP